MGVLIFKFREVFAAQAILKSINESAQLGLALDQFLFSQLVESGPSSQMCLVYSKLGKGEGGEGGGCRFCYKLYFQPHFG